MGNCSTSKINEVLLGIDVKDSIMEISDVLLKLYDIYDTLNKGQKEKYDMLNKRVLGENSGFGKAGK